MHGIFGKAVPAQNINIAFGIVCVFYFTFLQKRDSGRRGISDITRSLHALFSPTRR
jgi:hypothetical protein